MSPSATKVTLAGCGCDEAARLRWHIRVLYLIQALLLGGCLALATFTLLPSRSCGCQPLQIFSYEMPPTDRSRRSLENDTDSKVKPPRPPSRYRKPYHSYVDLPTYFRIPEGALMNFCFRADSYCMRRTPKLKKKNRGKRGRTGPPGPPGPCGCTADAKNVTKETKKPKTESKSNNVIDYSPIGLQHGGVVEERPEKVTRSKSSDQKAERMLQYEPIGSPNDNRCNIHFHSNVTTIATVKSLTGAWMRDTAADVADKYNAEKRWLTTGREDQFLYEYRNEYKLSKNLDGVEHQLPYLFSGTNHIVFNQSFYFHRKDTDEIIRYSLRTGKIVARTRIYKSIYNGANGLYPRTKTFFEFAVDRFGLYIAYKCSVFGFLIVQRLDPVTLDSQRYWTLRDAPVGNFSNTFMVCENIYAVEDSTAAKSRVIFAYDLKCNKLMKDVEYLQWPRPARRQSMMFFDDLRKQMWLYEDGAAMTLPVDARCLCGRKTKCNHDVGRGTWEH